MLKSILKLEGVKELSKFEQKNVVGGLCDPDNQCCIYCSNGWQTMSYCSSHNGVGQTCSGRNCNGCL